MNYKFENNRDHSSDDNGSEIKVITVIEVITARVAIESLNS